MQPFKTIYNGSLCTNDCARKEMLSNDSYVCPNEFTDIPDAKLTRSLLLLMLLGAETQQKLRF